MLDALDTKKGVPLLKKKKFFKKNLYYLRLIITFWLILWRSDQDGVICKERKMKVIEIIKTIIMNSSPFSHNLWQYSFHNISLSPHEQVCLVMILFERCFSYHRAMQTIIWCMFIANVQTCTEIIELADLLEKKLCNATNLAN